MAAVALISFEANKQKGFGYSLSTKMLPSYSKNGYTSLLKFPDMGDDVYLNMKS